MRRIIGSVVLSLVVLLSLLGCWSKIPPGPLNPTDPAVNPATGLRVEHDPSFGWTAAVPAEWSSCEVPGGQYSRDLQLRDPTKLILWTYFDRSIDRVLNDLVQVGGITDPTQIGKRNTPLLQWELYRGGARSDPDLAVEFAVAAQGSNVYLALIIARRAELTDLVNSVFIPAVDSFVPGEPDNPVSVLANRPSNPDYWPTNGWQTVEPEKQSMDGDLLQSMLDLIQEEALPIDSITVVRHGYVVLDEAFQPYQSNQMHELHSVTKSVISALVGIALTDNGLSTDAQVLQLLSAWHPINNDERKQAMTLENLLTMTAGLDWNEWSAAYESGTGNDLVQMIETLPDWTQYVLDRPMASDPGAEFIYNSGASYLLSTLVSTLTGQPAADYARQRLFTPLGISSFDWPASPEGFTMGWGNLRLRPLDLAKIGLLYLYDGTWDGQQIIPTDWVRKSTTDWVADPWYEYGYQWWLDVPDGYAYMSGRFGQTVIVAPKQDMVIVITANLPEDVMGALSAPRCLAEKYILPAAK